MSTVNWSATQYLAFEDERTRPARDLLAALPPLEFPGGGNLIDVGCGPGNSTELLAALFPRASVRGMDASADMIAAARGRLPAMRFDVAPIEHWLEADDEAFHVVLANAVLHWLPDHASLFPALLAKVAAGGALAVQMPDNLGEPAHRLMREAAAAGPWAGKLAAADAGRTPPASPREYHDLLSGSCRRVDVWRTTYHHVLGGGAAGIVEWFEGSGLRPFLAPLDAAEREDFLRMYRTRLAQAYPPMRDGSSVLLPFPRLFITALK